MLVCGVEGGRLGLKRVEGGNLGEYMEEGVVELGGDGVRMGVLYDLTRQYISDCDSSFRVVWKDGEVVEVCIKVVTFCIGCMEDDEDEDEDDEHLGDGFRSKGYEKVEVSIEKKGWV